MWKKINRILHDKNDYHLDPVLKHEVEISDELLQTTLKYQKYLIPKKIKYFFENDKLFFLRLFSKYLLKTLIFLIALGILTLVLLLAFGIDINFKKVKKVEVTQLPIYIPSSGDAKTDSLNILNYKKLYNDAIYITFYLKDPSKNYDKWKFALHGIESNGWDNPYEARRDGSQYWGKYQMSKSARESVGLGEFSWDKWKSNPEIQEAALKMWIDILYQELKSDIKKYDGQFLNGWSITESGIISMAHNVGAGATKQFLYSGGKKVPKDGSGKDATRFLILGNYNLEINK